jgi:RNA polymerase sigma factor (sigma-70 family)
MTAANANREVLLNLLLAGYDDLKSRLTRRLGSPDLAEDALQDTFLRLNTAAVTGPIRSPRAYLFRIAMSVAANRRVAERRRLSVPEEEVASYLEDHTPNPARIVEARSEIEAFKRAMNELPVRRREILVAARLHETPNQSIAQRCGVTVRTIQFELKLALTHCALRLDRNISKRKRSRSQPVSASDVNRTGTLQNLKERADACDRGGAPL